MDAPFQPGERIVCVFASRVYRGKCRECVQMQTGEWIVNFESNGIVGVPAFHVASEEPKPPVWKNWPEPSLFAESSTDELREDLFDDRMTGAFGDGLEADYCRDGGAPDWPALDSMTRQEVIAELCDWDSYTEYAAWQRDRGPEFEAER